MNVRIGTESLDWSIGENCDTCCSHGDNGFCLLHKYLKAIDKDMKPYIFKLNEVKEQESLMKRELFKNESSRLSC